MARKDTPVAVPWLMPERKPDMVHVGGAVIDGGLDGHKQRRMDFESLIPRGVTTQTANGTSHDVGTGNNRDEPWSSPQIEPRGAWPSGKSNRTAE